jgi:divalent metal cation (Fe/Co/Zn/Cd) transporter
LSLISVVGSGVVGVTAVVVAFTPSSLSLLGFGADAMIDALASVALIWRFTVEVRQPHRAERVELVAERVVGAVLLTLAAYLVVGAARSLAVGSHGDPSPVAIVLLVASATMLPLLGLAKRRTAARLASGALRADSLLTFVAAALAVVGLASAVLGGLVGGWWADPVGALVIAVVLAREAWASLRARGGLDEWA